MMAAFLIYSAKVAVCLLAFYGLFRLLLGNETFHGWNRFILLGTSLLSFILPLITIRIHKTVLPAQTGATPIPGALETRPDMALVEEMSALTQTPGLPTSIDPGTLQGIHLHGWDTILGIVFISGALYVLMRWIFSLINVIRLVRSGEKKTQTSEYTVIVTDRDIQPFSWMRYIILPRGDYARDQGLILQHEKAHVVLKHSYDRIAVDLMSVLKWFNPAIWLIREDLQALHEYEADEAVLQQGADIKEYQYLLVRKALSGSGYSITNRLAHKTLKKRITMMKRAPSGNGRRWKALWFLPLVAGFLALGSETEYVSAQTTGAQQPAVKEGTPRRLRDKYRHPLDTIYYQRNARVHSSRPIRGVLVDGVFRANSFEKNEPENLSKISSDIASIWVITDSATLVSFGLKPSDGLIGVTTKAYETTHGKPREVLDRERAQAHPEEPRAIDPASSIWLVSGAEGLETMPLFKGSGFEKFERWAMDHGASVRAADPKQYGSVTVSFVIDEKGRICSPKVIQGLSAATDQAVLEFLLNCPDWEPARKDGRPVPVAVVCPLTFNLLIR